MFRSSRGSRCGPEAWLPHHHGTLALTHTAKAAAEWEKGDGGGLRRGHPSEQCTCRLNPQHSDANPALSSLPWPHSRLPRPAYCQEDHGSRTLENLLACGTSTLHPSR